MITVRLLRQQRSNGPAVRPPPVFGVERCAFLRDQWRLDTENRVSLLLGKLRYRPNVERRQLATHFLRQPPHFLVQRTIAELQIVIADEIFDAFNFKWHPNRNAERADRKQFHDAFNSYRTIQTQPL